MTDTAKRYALVTGATGGLGACFAEGLAERGYDLVLSARNAEALAELAAQITARFDITVETQALDLAEPQAGLRLKQALDERGIVIETLINNAGFGTPGRFIRQPTDAELGMIDVNIHALTELTHLYARDMAERGGGHILLLASVAAFQPIPGYAVYAATKAFVLSLGHALHAELKRQKVVVSVLCPGPTETGFFGSSRDKVGPMIEKAMMQPDVVAQAGLSALYRGEVQHVPGMFNRLMAFSTRFAPRALQAKGAGRFMRK